MKFVTASSSIGYPVYGAKFLNNHMLLVAGGGGEGNNGIPNKLTVLRVDFAKKKLIKRFREITLDSNDDSPTTLDVANDLILMGCNENSTKIKNGEGNHHLRKFLYENEHLKYVAGIDFDRSKQPEDYTKLIYLSRDGSVGAIASSSVPTVIRIIDPKALTEKYEIETGHEVKDMHFAPDGKVIGYITASTLEVISIVTGRFIIRKTDFDSNYALSKIKFLTDDVVLITASLKKGPGIVMIKISLRSGSATVLKTKFITNKFKGVTAMDVDLKNDLAVLAGSDNSLALVKLKDFSLGRIFKQVHAFAITRVTFSPDSNLVASVSAANTVHVIKIPQNFAQSTSIWSKLWKLLLNFAFVALLAFLAQFSMKYDLHNKAAIFIKEWYEERRDRAIVKREDSEQVTLVGAVSTDLTISTPGSSSVTPTYSLKSSSVTTASESNDATPFSESTDIFLDEQISVSTSLSSWKSQNTSHEPSNDATIANVSPSTTVHSAQASAIASSYHAEADKSEPSLIARSSSSPLSGTTSLTSVFISTAQTPGITKEISDERTVETPTSKSKISEAITASQAQPDFSVSKPMIVTDTAAGLSIETAINSLSHHGATPKLSESEEELDRRGYEETTDKVASKEILTSTSLQIETTSTWTTSASSILDVLVDNEIDDESFNAKVENISGLTASFVNLASSTTREQPNFVGESPASSILHSHEEKKKSPTIATTEVKATPETANGSFSNDKSLSSSISGFPSDQESDSQVTGTVGSAHPDEAMVGVANTTTASSARAVRSDEKTERIESSGISMPSLETPTLSTSSTSASTSKATTVAADTILSSQKVPIGSFVSESQTLSAATSSSGSSSEASSSAEALTSISPSEIAESLAKISSVAASLNSIAESLSYLSSSSATSVKVSESTIPKSQTTPRTISSQFDVEEETANISSPKNTALAASGYSSQTSDSSLSVSPDGRTQEQVIATPTSDQISDNSHLEEIFPEYGQALETGSKNLHAHQSASESIILTITDKKISTDDSISHFPISSIQISSVEDESLKTSKAAIGQVSKSILLEEPDGIQEVLDHDFDSNSVTASTIQTASQTETANDFKEEDLEVTDQYIDDFIGEF